MVKFVQVNETIEVAEEHVSFYKDNNFTPLFDMGNEINSKLESIENMVDTVINRYTSKINILETEAAKQQWYTNFLQDLVQTNQALFGVMMLLNEKIND